MSHRGATLGRGFTLLEVLIAIAILGIGLSVVLSSQVGLFSSAQHASNLSVATGLVRCRMNELEFELLRDGYPLLDTDDQGPCCNDEYQEGFRCAWRIERVELPEAGNLDQMMNTVDGDEPSPDGEGLDNALSALGAPGLDSITPTGDEAASPMDALSSLAALTKNPEAALGASPDLGSLAGMMSGMGQAGGLASMAMGLVYPDLKPMLEASIRRVTVVVQWREGVRDRDLTVEQFLAFPQKGGFDPLAADGLDEALDTAAGAIPGLLDTGESTP